MTSRLRLRASGAALILVVFALGILVYPSLRTGAETASRVADPAGDAELPPGTAAMRATLNPETGVLEVASGPVAFELDDATREAVRRDDEGLVPVVHPDGSVSIDLQGRFQSVSVARINEHGTTITCAEHERGVNAAINGTACRHAPAAAEVK